MEKQEQNKKLFDPLLITSFLLSSIEKRSSLPNEFGGEAAKYTKPAWNVCVVLTNGPLTFLVSSLSLSPFFSKRSAAYICTVYSLKLLSSKRAALPRTLGLWRRGLTLAVILARQKPNHISFFSVKIYSGAVGQRFSLRVCS